MLKHRNTVLLVLFSAGFVKFSLFSPTISEALVLLIAGGVFAYCEYKNNDKRLETLEKRVSDQDIIIKDLSDKVSSIKIIQQVKPGSLTIRS